jgi:hypothetical protein
MSLLLGGSVCAKSNFVVVGSFPAAEASFLAVERSVAIGAPFFFVVAADFFGVDRVVATDAGFFADRVAAADVDFRVVDRVDLESAVSSLISFLTNSAFFRSAVPFTPRPCSSRRNSPTFIAAIALSRTSGVFGVSLPLVGFLVLFVAAMPIRLAFHRCLRFITGHTPRFRRSHEEQRTESGDGFVVEDKSVARTKDNTGARNCTRGNDVDHVVSLGDIAAL